MREEERERKTRRRREKCGLGRPFAGLPSLLSPPYHRLPSLLGPSSSRTLYSNYVNTTQDPDSGVLMRGKRVEGFIAREVDGRGWSLHLGLYKVVLRIESI